MIIDFNKYPLPKRLRHHTSPNMYLPVNEIKYSPHNYSPIFDKLDWSIYFADNRQPTSLDIGCGKGAFLLDYAESHSEENILGIDVRRPLVNWLDNVIKGESIKNCAVLWYSIANGMNFIDSGTIKNIFYFFPDPWPKTKHRKRRVLNEQFLKEISRVLASVGKLYISTDLEEIHKYHCNILTKNGNFEYQMIESDSDWNLPRTNKEKFCKDNDIRYWRLIATLKEL